MTVAKTLIGWDALELSVLNQNALTVNLQIAGDISQHVTLQL